MATRVDELRNGNAGPPGAYVDLDDRMLVLDFQAGNGNRDPAFAEIHRRYSGLARHVSHRILANAHDAEDATQETMLRVFQGLGRFNGRYRLQPWVARIATNVSLDILRARARRPQGADGELTELNGAFDDADEPSVLVEQLLERERIQKVLAQLPDHHREALVLREYEGRSHEEIGKALGVTPSQAKALIHRAKGSFRRRWDVALDERRGLGGLALAPLLWLAKLGGGFRRLADRASEAGQAVASQGVSATASTPVVVATSQTGERVVAAALTILVAGSVTVGAAAITHRRADPDRNRSVTRTAAAPAVVAPPEHESRKARAVGPNRATATRVKSLAIEPTPTPSVTTTPSPSPSVEPTPTTTTPPPVIAPEPTGYTVSASSDFQTTVRCECGTDPVMSDAVDAKPEYVASFSAELRDAGMADATGEMAWAMWLEQSSPDGVAHEMTFDLYTPEGPERYTAVGAVISREQTAWGGWTYVFEGEYAFLGGPPEGLDLVPVNGTYRSAVSFSVTQDRVVQVDLTLTQAPASPSPSPVTPFPRLPKPEEAGILTGVPKPADRTSNF